MSHSFTNLLYHLVFATKQREPWLGAELRLAVCSQFGGILKKEGGIALNAKGMPEHVHILAKLRPDQHVAEILSDLKARTSGWIHRRRKDLPHFAWQTGYGAFTVSQSQVEVVSRYIDNQEEHHRKVPFDHDYVHLLRRHGFDVAEQDLWE